MPFLSGSVTRPGKCVDIMTNCANFPQAWQNFPIFLMHLFIYFPLNYNTSRHGVYWFVNVVFVVCFVDIEIWNNGYSFGCFYIKLLCLSIHVLVFLYWLLYNIWRNIKIWEFVHLLPFYDRCWQKASKCVKRQMTQAHWPSWNTGDCWRHASTPFWIRSRVRNVRWSFRFSMLPRAKCWRWVRCRMKKSLSYSLNYPKNFCPPCGTSLL